MSDYYRVSKKTMTVIGSNLNCPALTTKARVPHTGRVFYIPVEIWDAWKAEVQRDLRPFIEQGGEYDARC